MAGYRPVPRVSGIEFCRSRIAAMAAARSWVVAAGAGAGAWARAPATHAKDDNPSTAVDMMSSQQSNFSRMRNPSAIHLSAAHCTHGPWDLPRIDMAYAARQIWCFPCTGLAP